MSGKPIDEAVAMLEALQERWCASTAGKPGARRIATFDAARAAQGEDDFDNEVSATRRCASDLALAIERIRALTAAQQQGQVVDRERTLTAARFRAACYALKEAVEGATGEVWRSESGSRLKDRPEWVSFYNLVSDMRERGGPDLYAQPMQQGGGEVIQRHVVTKYSDGSVQVADVTAPPPSVPVGVEEQPVAWTDADMEKPCGAEVAFLRRLSEAQWVPAEVGGMLRHSARLLEHRATELRSIYDLLNVETGADAGAEIARLHALAQHPAPSAPVGVDGFEQWYARVDARFWNNWDACNAAFHAGSKAALAQQPAAVDESFVERFCGRWFQLTGRSLDRPSVRACLTAALATQHQEPATPP